MEWKKIYADKLCSAAEAVKLVKDGDRVHLGTASSVAYKLAEALYERKNDFSDVTVCTGFSSRVLPFFTEEGKGHFKSLTYFAGNAERHGIKNGQTVFTSISLSEIDKWCWNTGRSNVAFIEVSPPDENGYMSYGAYGVVMSEALRAFADTVILQVNKSVPYVYGQDNLIHASDATAIVEADDNISVLPNIPFDDTLRTISDFVIDEIPDGATIQVGLGGVAGAVGFGLRGKNDLGIHSEMMTDSMMDLMKAGIVTNKAKNFMPGKAVVGFALGSQELYQYMDHNSSMHFAPLPFVNDVVNIGKNDNMISVNTAMAVDLYGQVCADCLAGKQQSAVGGQLDFVRGAQRSKGGKSFITLPSTLSKKDGSRYSRIMAAFPPGTAVTTPRADVQYVVTEYGKINLKALTIADRAKTLISLAHPDFRDELTEQAQSMRLFSA